MIKKVNIHWMANRPGPIINNFVMNWYWRKRTIDLMGFVLLVQCLVSFSVVCTCTYRTHEMRQKIIPNSNNGSSNNKNLKTISAHCNPKTSRKSKVRRRSIHWIHNTLYILVCILVIEQIFRLRNADAFLSVFQIEFQCHQNQISK